MDNSTLETLKGLLGDNADEKIKSVLSSLSSNTDGGSFNGPDQAQPFIKESAMPQNSSLESIAQIKNIVENLTNSNDSRSALLLSLKPYMRSSRQSSIDTAIKLLNISKLSGLFKL